MARKTVEIRSLVSYINGMLAAPGPPPVDLPRDPSAGREARRALQQVAEHVLYEADAYKGFAYIEEGGWDVSHTDIMAGDYDPTRVRYFLGGLP